MALYKRISIAISAVLCLTLLPLTNSAAATPEKFSFTGSGYGHGVGMSQIGARAKALAGESATAILNYYYSGTKVETATDSKILRINIGHLLTSTKVRSDSNGAKLQLFAGTLSESKTADVLLDIPSKTTLNVELSGNQLNVSTTRGANTTPIANGTSFTLRWSGTRHMEGSPTVISVTTNSAVNRYRYGQIQFRVIKDKLLGNRLSIINGRVVINSLATGTIDNVDLGQTTPGKIDTYQLNVVEHNGVNGEFVADGANISFDAATITGTVTYIENVSINAAPTSGEHAVRKDYVDNSVVAFAVAFGA